MDTHRGVCLCKRADAPVLQWLRSIRYQTASEDTVSHSVRVKDLIKSKIIQSIGVDDDMSRTWIRSLCPCFRDSNAPTEEQDQRLNLLTNQLSTASNLTLPKGECSIFSIEDSPRHVSPGRDQVASESTGAADLSREIEEKLVIVQPEVVVQTRKRLIVRQPNLPRISEATDSCFNQVVEEDLKFARHTWIHFSQCFEIDFCLQPPTPSTDRRPQLYSELCDGDDAASPLVEDARSRQHQRHSWPAVLTTRQRRSRCQWLSQSSVFLSFERNEGEVTEEKNFVARILLHNSQSQTLEPQRVLTCANASEAFSWNDALVLRNRLSHPNDLAQWYTSLDNEGRVFFYEDDSSDSLWSLPQVTSVPALTSTESEPQGIQQGVYYPKGREFSPKMNEQMTVAPVSTSKWDMVRQRTSKADRNSKTQSMVLTNFSGCLDNIAVENVSGETSRVTFLAPSKTASLPRNIQPQWPNLQGGSIVSDYLKNLDIRVLQQGFLHKTKLTDNGKKIRKNWTSSWVVLTDLFLFLFKESSAKTSNTAAGSSTGTNKPELCVDLNGATIEWAAVKSSRKGVFQVWTLLGVQLLLQDEDETNAVVWFNEIKRAIQQLPCGTKVETTNHYPSPHSSPLIGSKPKKLLLEKSFSPVESRHKCNDSLTQYLSPPSPDSPVSFSNSSSLMKQGSRKNKLGRTKSTKVPFLGSTEDLTAVAPGSSRERQDNLRDKLRKFFVRRPTVDLLVKKGIWKDEPVFGCHLSALCNFDGSTVPKFVQQVIQLIESKQENMKADGIYRASGNLSQIQKIRCQVDQYNWAILEIEDDVHVLTGCLKLFFRELKEPLIPCPLFEKALQATNYQGPNPERIRRYRDIAESLPTENYDTLQYLLQHLLKITVYREYNRMHISNLAIVFGPTLMWAATVSNNLALDMMQQNLVVEALLNNYHNIFNR
ncbi:rho GTPase-activating protein 12-like isoform X3 [Daphnia pulicaria]|uniref:rho GTPase-activating protein 12-like isoform X3 n=1 Tax=Daphnia pulicaria TaxID=35523 RepID=UPI001EEAA8F1|nr:rho GTPase-activating protein 12-like isoform X3 [Daphnia pulicaria]